MAVVWHYRVHVTFRRGAYLRYAYAFDATKLQA